jgi:peroxiredoxin
MRKLWILVLAVVLYSCQTTPSDSYTLTATVKGIDEGFAYLQDRIAGQMVPIDTAVIENGSFTFTGQLEYPEIYYIRVDGIRTPIAVFVENATITLTVDAENPSDYLVKGSKSHDILSDVNAVVAPHDERTRTLQEQINAAEKNGNEELADQLRIERKETENQRWQDVRDYVAKFPGEHAAVFVAMRQLAHGLSAGELSGVLTIFDPSLSGARYYDDIKGRITILERVAIGKPAIDFTLADTEGNDLSLSDLRGQYVLINFWASWCPYCRVENPHLVEVYERFSSPQFEILGVSLDREKEAWLKGIGEDGLQWPQVSDLKGWNSGPAGEYAVRSIPQNVLIDPDGTIIARNLKDKELEEKLEGLLRPV